MVCSFLIYRLLPRDSEAQYFNGKPQLVEFLCWLDYANRLARECCVPELVRRLGENIRVDLFEMSIEPMISILDTNIVGFMLVLMAKIIRQIDAPEFSDGKMKIFHLHLKITTLIDSNFLNAELATWLVGSTIVVDGDDLAVSTHENTAIIHTDCLLNIIIENAQDNQDILLPTLQFTEVCFSFTLDFHQCHSCLLSYILMGNSKYLGIAGQSKRTHFTQYVI